MFVSLKGCHPGGSAVPRSSLGLRTSTTRGSSILKCSRPANGVPHNICKTPLPFLPFFLMYLPTRTMTKNPLNKGVLTENGTGIGTVNPEMVGARARELAAIAGRVPPHPSPLDLERAERELTDGPAGESQETVLESIPESERWDFVPGSTGSHTADSLGEEEGSEGQSESAQLDQEGVK